MKSNKVKFTGEGVDKEFKGRVCFAGCIHDYTLCGITLDGDSETAGDYNTTDEKVNCRDCISIIQYCKSLKL